MNFTNYYIDGIRKYAVIKGRATRREYWSFTLVNIIISLILSLRIRTFIDLNYTLLLDNYYSGNILLDIYNLFIFIPSVCIGIRRLHDIGKSGWWYILAFIPFANILLCIFFCTTSDYGKNRFDE